MSGILTFDDLVDAPAPEESAPETVEETPEETPPEEHTHEVDSDEEVEEVEEEEEVEEASGDIDEGDPVETAEPKGDVLPGKELEAELLSGDKSKIHTGAYVTIPVNGKNERVQLQEVINNYAGHVAYNKKFSELNTQRTEFQRQQQMVNSHLGKIFDKAEALSSADSIEDKRDAAIDVLRLFGKVSGGDSFKLVTSLRKAFLDEARALAEMDDVDQKRYELEMERAFYNKDKDQERESKEEASRYEEYNQQAVKIIEDYGIDKQEFMDIKSELEEYMSKKGSDEVVTPKSVLEYRTTKLVCEASSEIHPEIMEDEKSFNALVDYALSERSTKAEIAEIIRETFGGEEKKRDERLSKKVKGKVKSKPKPAPKKNEPKKFTSVDSLWDDL